MSRKIEVCLTPALLGLYDIKNSIVVVIDILRATSSMVYGIDNGAKSIIPVSQVEDCLKYAAIRLFPTLKKGLQAKRLS
jgi:2-phosphosulfolactate phosphatase